MRRMPQRPAGAPEAPKSGNVPTVVGTSTLRVVSRTPPPNSEPLAITRTSMAAIEARGRSRRRVVFGGAIVGVAAVVAAGATTLVWIF